MNGQARQYSHVYAMPHVTRETVDALIADLAQPGAFPDQDAAPTPVPSKRPPSDARPLVTSPPPAAASGSALPGGIRGDRR